MDTNKISYAIGRIFGAILIGCVCACLAAIAIALTVSFITWLF